jgi:DNA/RNA endonuclease G (NUC1)
MACSIALLVVTSSTAKIGATYQMLLGNPSSATTNDSSTTNYLIQRDQYALSYNNTTGQPNWVSWNLTSDDIGSAGRSPDFFQDTTLPSSFFQILTTDYQGSGYDRGHMCPSADRTVTRADNDFTFYMSNMVPQAPDNNQGIWANFESYCRTLAQAGNEVLIISGPSQFNGSRILSGAAAIPGYTWKIVVVVPPGEGSAVGRITSSTRVIAIRVPNTAGVRTTPWQNFLTTIAQIEADTGYTFLTDLPPATAALLKTVVDGQPVTGLPAIAAPPTGQVVAAGGTAVFSVSATGDAPLSYQWMLDGEDLADATSDTLLLTNVGLANAGNYTVRVTNLVGSVTSSTASLVVTGISPQIRVNPSPIAAVAGTTENFVVGAVGSPTLTYQWRKDGVAIPGATFPVLTLTSVQQADEGTYDVVVANGVEPSVASVPAIMTVAPASPEFTQQPTNRTIQAGGSASFTVAAYGSAPLSFRWRRDGVDIPEGGSFSGAQTATLTLNNAQLTDGGLIDVVVSNLLGVATSSAALLTVNPAPTTTSLTWNFTTADPSGLIGGLTGGNVTQGNNNGTTALLTTTSASSGFTGASGGSNAGAAARVGPLVKSAGGSAYFEFTLTPAAGKQLSVSQISFGARSTSTGPQAYSLFSSVDNYTNPIASGTIANNSSWALKTNTVGNFAGATGTPVTFRLYGHSGSGSPVASTANWRIDDLALSVGVADAAPTPPALTATSPVDGATSVASSSSISLSFNQPVAVSDSWFTIESAYAGQVSATVTGGPTTFVLTPPVSFLPGDTITVTTIASKIRDEATGLIAPIADGTFTFSILVPQPPVITSQPVSVTVPAGEPAILGVVATGTPPFSYQWRRDGNAIADNPTATTAQLTISNVQAASAGNYDVVVSNGIQPTATSNPASLVVSTAAPTITQQPTDRVGFLGGSVAFATGAKGTEPMSFQWRRNGTPLTDGDGVSGSTTAVLNLSPLSAGSEGSYDVVIANGVAPAVTSRQASLVVNPIPEASILWDFSTASPTSGMPIDVSGGTVSSNNNNGTISMLSTTSASAGYSGASGTLNAGAAARTGALSTSPGGSAYFEFTLIPLDGRRVKFLSLSFGSRSTSTGPQAFAVYTSADEFATPLAAGTLANNGNWSYQSTSFAGVGLTLNSPLVVRIFGFSGSGSAGANTINWRIDDLRVGVTIEAPPVITVSPSSQNAVAGSNVSLSVAATGTAPLSYSWRFNGEPIESNPTATSPNLELSGIAVPQSGSYSVVVSNSLGSASASAMLTVVSKFDGWRAANFTSDELSRPEVSGATAVASADGLPNVVKYAFGLEPKTPASADRLPQLTSTGSDWVYQFKTQSGRDDVSISVEAATALDVAWSTQGVVVELVGTDGLLQVWQAKLSKSLAPTKAFFRLKVSI